MLCWILQFFFLFKPGCWFIYLKSLNHFFLKIHSLSKQRHLINFSTPSNPERNHKHKANGANTEPSSISQDSNLCWSQSLHRQRREGKRRHLRCLLHQYLLHWVQGETTRMLQRKQPEFNASNDALGPQSLLTVFITLSRWDRNLIEW